MSKRSWNELVSAGREALAQESGAQWTLGDLALELEPVKIGGGAPKVRGNPGRGIYARLEKYAEELGTTYRSLVSYRMVAHAWKPEDRSQRASFSVHTLLMPEPGRVGMLRKLEASKKDRPVSVADALKARGKKPRRLTLVDGNNTVPVTQHERHAPSKVTPIRKPQRPADYRRLIEGWTPAQIGRLIDACWAVLEEQAA